MVKKIRTYIYSFWHNPRTWKYRRFHVPQPTFLFPLKTPLRLSRNMLHGWKDNSMLANPLAAPIYPSYTMLKSMRKSKNRYFHHIFVSPGDAPRAITLNVVWMEREFDAYKLSRSMYHLSSTVSQIFEPQVQKIAVFTYSSPHFCFHWRRPCDYHAIWCMDGKTI